MISMITFFPFFIFLFENTFYLQRSGSLPNNTALLTTISETLNRISVDTANNTYVQIFVTVVTILASLAIAFGVVEHQDKKNKDRVTDITKKILKDQINEINSFLSFPPRISVFPILVNQNPAAANIIFVTDFYDGLINTAAYLDLDDKLRSSLVSFFNRVKQHNQMIMDLNRMAESSVLGSETSSQFQELIAAQNISIVQFDAQIISDSYKYIDELNKNVA